MTWYIDILQKAFEHRLVDAYNKCIMKIKDNMTFRELSKYLEGIGEARSDRTIRRWLKGQPAVNGDNRPKKYETALLSEVLLRHNISKLRHDYVTQRRNGQPSIWEDEERQYIKDHFNQLKTDIILRFILEKLGYRFNEMRLKEDLKNKYSMLNTKDISKLKPTSQRALTLSVERLEKHRTDYYLRKVRSDKKK